MKKKLLFIFFFGIVFNINAQEYSIKRLVMESVDFPTKGKIYLKGNELTIILEDQEPTVIELSKPFNGEFPYKSLIPNEDEFFKSRLMLTKREDDFALIWDMVDEFTHKVTTITYIMDESND